MQRREIYMHRSGSVFRVYMGGNAIVSWYIAMTDNRSLLHSVSEAWDGAALMWILMVLGACAVVDAVVNDLLPQRYHWRVALRQRHFILVGMAFCFLTQIYIAFAQSRSTGLVLYYLWNASMIMLAAFLDAHQRLKDAKCLIARNS